MVRLRIEFGKSRYDGAKVSAWVSVWRCKAVLAGWMKHWQYL